MLLWVHTRQPHVKYAKLQTERNTHLSIYVFTKVESQRKTWHGWRSSVETLLGIGFFSPAQLSALYCGFSPALILQKSLDLSKPFTNIIYLHLHTCHVSTLMIWILKEVWYVCLCVCVCALVHMTKATTEKESLVYEKHTLFRVKKPVDWF